MKIKVTFTGYNAVVTSEVIRVYKVAPFGQPDGITESIFTAKGQLIGASAADTPVAISPGTDGQVPIYDSSVASGIRPGTPSVAVDDNTNNLINGGFDYAQRQAAPGTDTTIADEKYGPDRWRCTRENADLQYSRQDASSQSGLTCRYYGKFTKITNAGKFAVYQPLEFANSIPLRGRDVIFQVQMKASTAKTIKIAIVELAAAGTADTLPAAFVSAWNVDSTDPTLGTNLAVVDSVQSCSVTTSWQNFSVTATIPSDSKNLILAIWTDADFSAADWLALAEAGYYRGSSTQTWAPRHITDELKLCQRYYFLAANGDAVHLGLGFMYSTTVLWLQINFPVKMRTTPTLDATSGTDYYEFVRNSGSDTFNSLTIGLGGENIVTTLYNSTEISGTAGYAGRVKTNNASARVGFTAEL